MAWLVKSDGKLDCSLFINFSFLAKRFVVKRVVLEYYILFTFLPGSLVLNSSLLSVIQLWLLKSPSLPWEWGMK